MVIHFYVHSLGIIVLAFFGTTKSSVSSLFDLKHTYIIMIIIICETRVTTVYNTNNNNNTNKAKCYAERAV